MLILRHISLCVYIQQGTTIAWPPFQNVNIHYPQKCYKPVQNVKQTQVVNKKYVETDNLHLYEIWVKWFRQALYIIYANHTGQH
jgi:hypothetical protein